MVVLLLLFLILGGHWNVRAVCECVCSSGYNYYFFVRSIVITFSDDDDDVIENKKIK